MRKGLTPLWIGVAVLAVSIVGAGAFFLAQNIATTTQQTFEEADGEFDQVGLAHSNIESPFKGINGFQTITVDSDASAGTAEVLDQAQFDWRVKNATDISLEERSSVQFFETDGALEEVEVEYTDETTGTNYADDVSIQSVDFYDYEAAVDQDSLSDGEQAVDFSIDGMQAEAEVGSLTEGEYAVVPTYKFDSGVSTPNAAATDKLNNLNIDSDTDGDVDAVQDVPVRVDTYE